MARLVCVEVVTVALLLGCGSDPQGSSEGAGISVSGGISQGDGDVTSGSNGDGDGDVLDLGSSGTSDTNATTTGDNGDCECAPHSDLIYVLSDSATLWSFDPQTYQFTQIGAFDCGTLEGTFSMGVSRNGSAWIMFSPSGDIYTVDLANPNICTDPGYMPNQIGFGLFGMAYSANSVNDSCDRLYAHTFDGVGWSEGPNVGKLGRLEPNLQMVPLGAVNYNGGELTGTGDGRLYAFAGVPTAKLIQYDKTNANVIESIPLGIDLTYAFAFAFWGGDFYFFTESSGISSVSKVTKLDYDGSDGNGMALTTVVQSAPIRIVGAGVSTCAPYMPIG